MAAMCVEYTVEESIFSSTNEEWQCFVDGIDTTCLRILNKNPITLPDPYPQSIGVCKMPLGVRVSVPKDYCVILLEAQVAAGNRAARAQAQGVVPDKNSLPRVANGVIDSGYRGEISAVIYYDATTRYLDRGGMAIRLAQVRLVPRLCLNARMLFDLYAAGAEHECGFKFVNSIRAAAESDALDGEHQSPPDGNDVWDGTGCRTIAYLRNAAASECNQYATADSNVRFAIVCGAGVAVGFRNGPRAIGDSSDALRFFNNSSFCTLLPFRDTFSDKREEDAGYDITSPVEVVLEPMATTLITVRQRYSCQDTNVIPCVYGRSSMNAKGLTAIPTRWVQGEWLTVAICNTTNAAERIRVGDRIAQLLLVQKDGGVLLPCGCNTTNPFPRTRDSGPKNKNRRAMPKWRKTLEFAIEAPASFRGTQGFGSTGL